MSHKCGKKVYPRVCGGTLSGVGLGIALLGLSPRVRGNLLRPWFRKVFAGSIPACAGEPARNPPAPVRLRVYPRVCGGTLGSGLNYGKPGGLSPRVRGNRWRRPRRR